MKMVNKQARKKGLAVGLAAENWDYSRKKRSWQLTKAIGVLDHKH
jgi:hypothetical protein